MKTIRLWQRIRSSLRALCRKEQLDQEMDEELRSHLEQRIRANIAAGMSPPEARRIALRKFGWPETIKETCRDQRGVSGIEHFIQDLCFGLRMLRKNPGFTFAAVVTLALGLALSTAVFGIVDWIWLRPSPFAAPDQLIRILAQPAEYEAAFSYPDYLELRQAHSLSGLAAEQHRGAIYRSDEVSELLDASIVSRNFFDVLGVTAFLGRVFAEQDDGRMQATPGIVISYRFWQRRFHGDASVIGKSITLGGRMAIVLGVTPKSFMGTDRLEPRDVWYPIETQGPWGTAAGLKASPLRGYLLVGRLKPGSFTRQTQSELQMAFARLELKDPATRMPQNALVLSESAYQTRQHGNVGGLLLSLAGIILLIACANVSGLFLAKGETRLAEIAIRQALGSGRGRLVRQLFTESLLLTIIAGSLGLLMVFWLIKVFPGILPPGIIDRSWDVRLDARLVGFAVALTLGTALLSGLMPAWHGSKVNFASSLKSDTAAAGLPRRRRFRLNGLVAGQLALSFALLYGAGLLAKSLLNCYRMDLGFQKEKSVLLVNHLTVSTRDKEELKSFYRQVLERVATLPGTRRACLASDWPRLATGSKRLKVTVPAAEASGEPAEAEVRYYTASEHFFDILGIRLLRGRSFRESDTANSPRVAMINESMARRFWPGQNPLGKPIYRGLIDEPFREPPRVPLEIVGVVQDGRYHAIGEPPQSFLFLPWDQGCNWMGLMVETENDPAVEAASVRREIRSLRSDVDLYQLTTLRETIRTALFEREATAEAAGLISFLGLLLSGIGLCGVVAYVVSQRTREIGIRMTMGATRNNVLRLIMQEAFCITLVGLVLGGLLAFTAGCLLQGSGKLFRVASVDPLILFLSTVAVIGAVLLASLGPARRASKVDPMVALRYE